MVPIVDIYVIDRIHAVELLPLLNRDHRSGDSRTAMIVDRLSGYLSNKRVFYPHLTYFYPTRLSDFCNFCNLPAYIEEVVVVESSNPIHRLKPRPYRLH